MAAEFSKTIFGRSEISPVIAFLKRDLKGLGELIVVRNENVWEETDVEEMEGRLKM
jgi:hypothetical protein